MPSITDYIAILVIFVQLITTIYLYRSYKKNQSPFVRLLVWSNIYLMVALFFVLPFIDKFTIFYLFVGLHFFFLLRFIHKVFQSMLSRIISPFYIVTISLSLLSVILNNVVDFASHLVTISELFYLLIRLTFSLNSLIIYILLISSSVISLRSFQKNPEIPRWLKIRYQIIIIDGFFYIGVGIAWSLVYVNRSLIPFIMAILMSFGILGDFIAWVMPSTFRNIFKEKKGIQHAYSFQVVNFLGESLSKKIDKPIQTCRGIIRIWLKEVNLSEDRFFIEDLIKYKNSLQEKLTFLTIENSQAVVQSLIDSLKEKESVFTFGII